MFLLSEASILLYSSGHVRGRRVDAKKHRQMLEEYIKESDQKSGDSGYDDGLEEEDDAIELLGKNGTCHFLSQIHLQNLLKNKFKSIYVDILWIEIAYCKSGHLNWGASYMRCI